MSSNDEQTTFGRVKWFNNKTGYGFITALDGEHSGLDVFAHHSGIQVGSEQYRYLVQGEYVSFKLLVDESKKDHKFHAEDITGVLGGMLMCETRNLNRQSRDGDSDSDGASTQKTSERTRRPRNPKKDNSPSLGQWVNKAQ